jgi:hypothetical protein
MVISLGFVAGIERVMAMSSLTDRKSKWEIVKLLGGAAAGAFIPISLGSGGVALFMGAAKTAVTMAAVFGGGLAIVLGGSAFVAGALMVSKIEKKIQLATPQLSADDLKKFITPAPAEPAPAPDLSKEFNQGVDNVETMKPLQLKAKPDAAPGMKLTFKPKTENKAPVG